MPHTRIFNADTIHYVAYLHMTSCMDEWPHPRSPHARAGVPLLPIPFHTQIGKIGGAHYIHLSFPHLFHFPFLSSFWLVISFSFSWYGQHVRSQHSFSSLLPLSFCLLLRDHVILYLNTCLFDKLSFWFSFCGSGIQGKIHLLKMPRFPNMWESKHISLHLTTNHVERGSTTFSLILWGLRISNPPSWWCCESCKHDKGLSTPFFRVVGCLHTDWIFV
jgi:hypothetical protein